MTQYLEQLQIGNPILCEARPEKISYEGFGKFEIEGRANIGIRRKIGFVCGGSGITPAFSIMESAAREQDGVSMKLVYCNHTSEAVMLKPELQK